MSLLDDTTEGVEPTPFLALLYGPPGVGKTTMAASVPGALYLPFEAGTKQLNVRRVKPERLATFAGVRKVLGELATQDHGLSTVVIDTVTGLQALVWQETCRRGGNKASIEDFGYGKGYVLALAQWELILADLDRLRARGISLLLLAHEVIKTVKNPEGPDYDQKAPDLDKQASQLIVRWVDNVFHATWQLAVRASDKTPGKGKGFGDGTRVVRTEYRPGALAKNRYDMPYELPLDWDTIYDAMAVGGAVEGALDAYTREARTLAQRLPPERQAKALETLTAASAAGDLKLIRRCLNKLRTAVPLSADAELVA